MPHVRICAGGAGQPAFLPQPFKQHKYARRYLAEAAYRFNRRFRLPEFVPRLLRAMVLCMPTPEPLLRQATNFSS